MFRILPSCSLTCVQHASNNFCTTLYLGILLRHNPLSCIVLRYDASFLFIDICAICFGHFVHPYNLEKCQCLPYCDLGSGFLKPLDTQICQSQVCYQPHCTPSLWDNFSAETCLCFLFLPKKLKRKYEIVSAKLTTKNYYKILIYQSKFLISFYTMHMIYSWVRTFLSNISLFFN